MDPFKLLMALTVISELAKMALDIPDGILEEMQDTFVEHGKNCTNNECCHAENVKTIQIFIDFRNAIKSDKDSMLLDQDLKNEGLL